MEFISRSQAGQDRFVYLMIEKYLGMKDYKGKFLDIGACYPIQYNNTYEFERRGWTGMLFELEDKYAEDYKKQRKSPFYIGDVRFIDWVTILTANGFPEGTVFDYMSLDIDDGTLEMVRNFPWDKYTFRFITAEHDLYKDGPEKKKEMYETFTKLGYICLHENVANEYNPMEDWWAHPSLVKTTLLPSERGMNLDWTVMLPYLEGRFAERETLEG